MALFDGPVLANLSIHENKHSMGNYVAYVAHVFTPNRIARCKRFREYPHGDARIPDLRIVNWCRRRVYRYEPMGCQRDTARFFIWRHFADRCVRISNITNRSYFNRIGTGDLRRRSACISVICRCDRFGHKWRMLCSNCISNDCWSVFSLNAPGANCFRHGACWIR